MFSFYLPGQADASSSVACRSLLKDYSEYGDIPHILHACACNNAHHAIHAYTHKFHNAIQTDLKAVLMKFPTGCRSDEACVYAGQVKDPTYYIYYMPG